MPLSFTPIRKPGDEPYALFQIAQEHYVGARLALVGDALYSAQLLVHQCIETGAKALLKAEKPDRKFHGSSGHKLRTFLEELAPTRPGIGQILGIRNASRLIDVLDKGYTGIRYGEGVFGVELAGALRTIDRIATLLLTEVSGALGAGLVLSLSVRRRALPVFLWELDALVLSVENSVDPTDDPWATAQVRLSPQPQS